MATMWASGRHRQTHRRHCDQRLRDRRVDPPERHPVPRTAYRRRPSFPFGYLKLVLALHGSALPDGSYGGNPCGFLLTTQDNHKIYLACDTGLFGDMRLIGEEGIDLAVLPIGDNFTMGPDDALRAVKLIQPKHVIPVHYNTFGLIAQDAHAWAARVKAETIADPHVLKPGESFTLK